MNQTQGKIEDIDIAVLAEKLIPAAAERIRPYVRETYLQRSDFYSQLCQADVYLKCENLQHTGSFKLRGALNKVIQSDDNAELVAASTGNHGKAVAFAARKFGRKVTVFAPESANAGKLQAIRRLGAEVQFAGSDCLEAEHEARRFSNEQNATYISPYNDLEVIAGQGTIGWEICQQIKNADAVFASVGGGGMLAGIAACIRSQVPACQFIGCSPENSKVMIESIASKKILDLSSTATLSDGTAGGLEANSITFPLCCELLDQTVTVTEQEIAEHLLRFVDEHGMLIEGAAAVCLASLDKVKQDLKGKEVVILLCGANVSSKQLLHAKQLTEQTVN